MRQAEPGDSFIGDSFIVVFLSEPRGFDGTYSLWDSAPDAQSHVQSLLREGASASRIVIYRARPAGAHEDYVAASEDCTSLHPSPA